MLSLCCTERQGLEIEIRARSNVESVAISVANSIVIREMFIEKSLKLTIVVPLLFRKGRRHAFMYLLHVVKNYSFKLSDFSDRAIARTLLNITSSP